MASRFSTPNVVAVAVFVAALGAVAGGLAEGGFLRSVVAAHVEGALPPTLSAKKQDLRLSIYLVSRNARALLTKPHRLFDSRICFPARNSLALGESGIALGVVGIPYQFVLRDPVAVFNAVWLSITFIAAWAMYLLVRAWTGVPAAGLVAGVVYAFHPSKASDVVTPYVQDTGWTVLALLFATRLMDRGRWRDAIGLGFCVSMQLSGSLYPLLGAVSLALPMLLALVLYYGTSAIRPTRWLFATLLGVLTASIVFPPYLELREAGDLAARSFQAFLAWSALAPGSSLFPGWTVLALASAALALGRRRCVGTGRFDPRWPLLVGGALAANLAMGGSAGEVFHAYTHGEPPPPALPNLYSFLASVLPGLDMIRRPDAISSALHIALSALAGLGAAALLRSFPSRLAPWVAVALIVVAGLEMVRPRALGLEATVEFASIPIRPRESALAFFRQLEEMGNSGPILELPVNAKGESILLSAYHGRPTSRCHGSFIPRVREDLKRLGGQLPARRAVDSLRAAGFTTIVVNAPAQYPQRLRFDRAAAGGAPRLRRLLATPEMCAYELLPERGGAP